MSGEQLAENWARLSSWEMLAVALAITYLLLAVRQNRWCWVAAFVSTAIFTALFWNVELLMQSALNVYYMGMAVYGWWQWGRGGNGELPVQRWRWQGHALALALVLGATVISGHLLSLHTQAAWPYLDSFITWGAVVTTFMVARKVLENWAWWMLINALAVFLFIERGMLLTAGLHLSYLVISVFGWIGWYRDYHKLAAQPSGR
ncbi:MAG: nicotinamide riboside transporter PnuC [Wenzhouxiangella sp.]|nr:MAG: nicotinamide riboside transporter PnuC [Wenzhouxiangella sp.]